MPKKRTGPIILDRRELAAIFAGGAVGTALRTKRIMLVLPELLETAGHRMITLERARFTADEVVRPAGGAEALPGEAVKLTAYGSRAIRADGQPGYVAAVDVLKQSGATGAVVLLAVDGTLHGRRQRARFFARNANVPLMLVAVGPAASLSTALTRLRGLIPEPVVTIERVQTLRSQGRSIASPIAVAEHDPSGFRSGRR